MLNCQWMKYISVWGAEPGSWGFFLAVSQKPIFLSELMDVLPLAKQGAQTQTEVLDSIFCPSKTCAFPWGMDADQGIK